MYDLLVRTVDGKTVIQIDAIYVESICVRKLDDDAFAVIANKTTGIEVFKTEEAAKLALDNICQGIAKDWGYIKLNADGSCELG